MMILGYDLPLAAVIGIGVGVLLALFIVIGLLVGCCCCMFNRAANRRRKDAVVPLPPSSYHRKGSMPNPPPPGYHHRGPPPQGHPLASNSWNHRNVQQSEVLPAKFAPPPPPAGMQQRPMHMQAAPPPKMPGRAGGEKPHAVTAKWEEDLRAGLFRKVSLAEVRAATGGFNKRNFLGEGAFAVVFKGRGPSGVPWAVKRSKRALAEGSAGAMDFENEVMMISRLSHKNLVRLLGYCIEGGEHILVYEFAENGSLGAALAKSRPHMTFQQRLDIAIGTAEALHYLHNAASPPIVHRDIKPDNILLDRQMNVKVGDFGLLKNILEGAQHESVYTRVAGTPGYLDPEYHLTSKITVKGDVYSFGVVLLELFTGRRAIITSDPISNTSGSSAMAPLSPAPSVKKRSGDEEPAGPVHISQWVLPHVKARQAEPLVDSRLGLDYSPRALLTLIEIALQCVRTPSRSRPDMGGVVRSLVEVREMLQQEEEGGPEESVEHYGGVGVGLLHDSDQLDRQISTVDDRSERNVGSSGRGDGANAAYDADNTIGDGVAGGALIASASGRSNSTPRGSARIVVGRSGSGSGRNSLKSNRGEEKQESLMNSRGDLVVDMDAEEPLGKTGREEMQWGEESLQAPQRSSSYVSLTVENRANEVSGIFPR